MGLFVSTTGTNVAILELGITITHPTTNRDLIAQFSQEEVKQATSLTAAIQAGTLTWKFTATDEVQNPVSYDPETTEIDNKLRGSGKYTSKVLALAATTIALKSGDATLNIFTGTTSGQIIKLPIIVTSDILGLEFIIINMGTQSISFRTQDGAVLFSCLPDTKTTAMLEDNSTANGTWFVGQAFNNTATGIVNYKISSSTTFTTSSATDVVITGFTLTPISGTYAVWFSASITITQNNALLTSTAYKNGSPVADSRRVTQGTSSNWIGQSSLVDTITFDGTEAVDIRVKSSSGSISILDRTLLLIRLGA